MVEDRLDLAGRRADNQFRHDLLDLLADKTELRPSLRLRLVTECYRAKFQESLGRFAHVLDFILEASGRGDSSELATGVYQDRSTCTASRDAIHSCDEGRRLGSHRPDPDRARFACDTRVPDANVVKTRRKINARIYADPSVAEARSVSKRVGADGGTVEARGVLVECVPSGGSVRAARGVAVECFKSARGVAGARGVEVEREGSVGRVVGAVVAGERVISGGGVGGARGVAPECEISDGCVDNARGVVRERVVSEAGVGAARHREVARVLAQKRVLGANPSRGVVPVDVDDDVGADADENTDGAAPASRNDGGV